MAKNLIKITGDSTSKLMGHVHYPLPYDYSHSHHHSHHQNTNHQPHFDFLSSFQHQMTTREFKHAFKHAVHDSINDEIFMSEMSKRGILDQIPRIVHAETKSTLARQLPKDLKPYLDSFSSSIPGHVAKNLHEQVPQYLANHVAMDQILKTHETQLHDKLSQTAESILDRVVKEDKYHTLTNSLVSEIRKRSEDGLAQANKDSKTNLQQINETFGIKFAEMQEQVLKEMDTLKQSNNAIQKQNTVIKDLNDRFGRLTIAVSITSVMSGALLLNTIVSYF